MLQKICASILLICLTGKVSFSTDNFPEPPYHAKKTNTPPVIDGLPIDTCWSLVDWAPIDQVWIGQPTTPDDYTGMFKVVWTPDRLYVLMKFIRKIVIDNYPANGNNIYNYDCAEIFIDEDHSGGAYSSGPNCYNAFAYHLSDKNNVYDFGANGQGWYTFNQDIKLIVDSSIGNHTYYWEVEMKVFTDKYVFNGNNTPVNLFEGKVIGFSTAYNTNDGGPTRKNMFGSHYLPGPDKNTSWDNASDLGELILDGDSVTTIPSENNSDFFRCYPNPAKDKINIYFEDPSIGIVKIKIFNILGIELKRLELSKNLNNFHKELNISYLPKGIYFLKISDQQKQYLQKISIQ